jgi:BirA family transcriptional regulator, biotin operon repressor / biotin---[acetyl-CoA-carboxylase] ligase
MAADIRVNSRSFAARIEWFERLDSTMTEAARRPEIGRIVVAGEQTAGIGRHGRRWHSAANEGLYVSMVLRPRVTQPLIMLALGLAVRQAIEQTAHLMADLRWPNDVLLRGRKCAGILAHANGEALIAGIGINVSQAEFPEGLETPATSLLLEGARVEREDLLGALVLAVDDACLLPGNEILRQFQAASTYASGQRVRFEGGEGVTLGLDPSGFLIVREDNGRETTIVAGGVRPA